MDLDVKTAIDTMDHCLLCKALTEWGVHPLLIAAVNQELTDLRASLEVPSVGLCGPFEFSMGGKMGGAETSTPWRILLDRALQPVVLN